MNDTARRIIDSRMRRGDRRPVHEYEDRPMDHGRDYRDGYRGDYRSDYRGDYREDHRRDYREPERDGRYERDYRGEEREGMKLPRHEMKEWKQRLKNADGTTGEHFTAEQMKDVSHQVGASFEEYDEADLCMAANMLYSDLCEALRMLVPKEKEALIYAKMARYWLEDEDGPKGSEKLAMYFYCIVEDE